jgi:hypothetical protein
MDMAWESAVQASIKALIEHYDQPIHYSTDGSGYLQKDEKDLTTIPRSSRFVAPESPEHVLPGILTVLWDRLQQQATGNDSSSSSSSISFLNNSAHESSTRACRLPVLLLEAYPTLIRSHIQPNIQRQPQGRQGMDESPNQYFGGTLDHNAWSRLVAILTPYQLLVQHSVYVLSNKGENEDDSVLFRSGDDGNDDNNNNNNKSLWLVVDAILDDMVWWLLPLPPVLPGKEDDDDADNESVTKKWEIYRVVALVLWSRLVYAALGQLAQSDDWTQNVHVGTRATTTTVSDTQPVVAQLSMPASLAGSRSQWDILRHCTCTLLGVGNDHRTDCLLVGDWDDALVAMVSNPLSYCSLPLPTQSSMELEPQACYQTRRAVLQSVGLVADSATSKPSAPETLELSQCLASIWTLVEQQLVPSTNAPGSPETTDPFHSHSPPPVLQSENNEQLCSVQRRVLAALGWAECSRAVRAHFFGTDRTQSSDALPLRPRLHMGRTVTEPSTNITTALSTTKAHHIQRSRWAATQQFVALLPRTTPAAWLELAPVVYEMLNSAQEYDVQWGAVLLHRLLRLPCHNAQESVSAATSAPHRSLPDGSSAGTTTAPWHAWPNRAVLDNLATFLEQAIARHRVGLTLAVLGVAQRALFHRRHEIHRRDKDHLSAQASFAQGTAAMLHTWLLILDRHSRHYTKQHLIWGLLYGGIVPLLYDAASAALDPATSTASGVYCVEVGRLGLSALFSVLREESDYTNLFGDHCTTSNLDDILYETSSSVDGTDNETMHRRQRFELSIAVHMAALTALLNLLVAAHPIMDHHAGKIMCELVAYLCKLNSVIDQGNLADQHVGLDSPQSSLATESFGSVVAVYQLASHTAAVALVVCGEPAQCVLTRIESSEYNNRVVEVVATMRRGALDMQANLAKGA